MARPFSGSEFVREVTYGSGLPGDFSPATDRQTTHAHTHTHTYACSCLEISFFWCHISYFKTVWHLSIKEDVKNSNMRKSIINSDECENSTHSWCQTVAAVLSGSAGHWTLDELKATVTTQAGTALTHSTHREITTFSAESHCHTYNDAASLTHTHTDTCIHAFGNELTEGGGHFQRCFCDFLSQLRLTVNLLWKQALHPCVVCNNIPLQGSSKCWVELC